MKFNYGTYVANNAQITGSALSGDFAGVAAGIGGQLMSLFGDSASEAAARQYKYQRLLNKQAYNLTQQGYRESPLNQRIGYESAGVNPIFAMSNGASFGSYSGGSASAPMDSTTAEMGSMITNAYKAFQLERNKTNAEILGINAGIKNTNADTALKAELAMTEKAKQIQMDFQNTKTQLESELLHEDLTHYERRFKTEMLEMMNRAEDHRASAVAHEYDMITNRMNAETNAYWTPGKIVAGAVTGLGVGAMTALGPGKFVKGAKVAKALKDSGHISKVTRSLHTFGRTKIH